MSKHLKLHSFTGTSDHDFTGLVSGQIISYNGTGISSLDSVTSFSASTLSGGTILSGSTDLYDIFATPGSLTNFVPLTGTSTNISGDIEFDDDVNLSFNGGNDTIGFDSAGGDLSINASDQLIIDTANGADFANGAILSGGTDLYSIFITSVATADITRVSGGTNINTGGTANLPVINLDNDIVLTSVNATTLSGGTIYSGSTDIYDIFSTTGGNLWSASTGVGSIIANNGSGNTASGQNALAGGIGSTASGDLASFSFGYNNTSSDYGAVTLGGYNNLASGSRAVVLGGGGNIASANSSLIIGGSSNFTLGKGSSIIGGSYNFISETGSLSFIGGGIFNSATTVGSSVVGGNNNAASGKNSVIIGGTLNTASAPRTIIIGGQNLTNNVADSVMVSDLTVDGNLSAGTSGSVIYSAGTDLYNIFATSGSGIQGTGTVNTIAMWNGTNTITDSILTFDGMSGITVAGDIFVEGNVEVLGTATTINTQDLFVADNTITLNSGGTATSATGGGIFIEDGVINGVDASWTIDSNGNWTTSNGIRSSAMTISSGNINVTGGVIYSAGTDLYNIFLTSSDITRVSGGTNISTGGTANNPIINLEADIILTSVNTTMLSGGTIYSGSTDISDLFAPATGGYLTGSGTDNTVPLWNGTTGLDDSILSQAGTVITASGDMVVTGNFDVLGTATTINTQTLQAADNNIELNYSGNSTSATGGGMTVLSGVSNSVDATWQIDATGNWAANAGIQGATVTATDFFSMVPKTGVVTAVDNDAWFHSGATGSITLNYKVGGVEYAVELV